MLLETMPQLPAVIPENITQAIQQSASEAIKPVLSSFLEAIKPLLIAIGGLLGLYIIYKIIQAIISHIQRKRIKRIDDNVQELNKKVDEILKILKKKKKS